jgi:hypothetical protein
MFYDFADDIVFQEKGRVSLKVCPPLNHISQINSLFLAALQPSFLCLDTDHG